MESALYGIFTLVGEVSEIPLVRCAPSFDFRYFTNSCENPVRARFPWSNLYVLTFCNDHESYWAVLLMLMKPYFVTIHKSLRDVTPHFNLTNLVLLFLSRGGSFTAHHPDSPSPPTASSSRSDLVYSGRQQKSWNFDGYSSDNDVMSCFCCFISMFPLRPLHKQNSFLIVSHLDGSQLWPSGVTWVRGESAVESRSSGER